MHEKIEINNNIALINTVDSEIFFLETLQLDSAIYKDISGKKIGIAYLDNKLDDEKGYLMAKKAVKYPYPHMPSINMQTNIQNVKDNYKSPELVESVIKLLQNPVFTGKDIKLSIERDFTRHNYTNDMSLHLNSERLSYKINLKVGDDENKSDYILIYDTFDTEKIALDIVKICTAREKIINHPMDKIIIGSRHKELYDYLEYILNPENMDKYSFLYGSKIFKDNFTLYTSLNHDDYTCLKYGILPFFDWEGSYNIKYRKPLIDRGVVMTPYTNKDKAEQLEINTTSCAYGKGDNYCENRLIGAYIKPENSVENTLKGEEAIFIKESDIKAGIDKIVIDAKECFVTDGKNLISRYPSFKIEVNPKDFFVDGFVASCDSFPLNSNENSLIFSI